MNKSVRNIMIFGLVTLVCGFLGKAVNTLYNPPDSMQSLGVLVWLVSPLAANLVLRSLGKDGWQDFGIRLNLKSSWRWYLAALFMAPVISLVMIILGRLLGVTALSGSFTQGSGMFISLFVTAFAGNAVKNIFEEFAWRGYLTPMLERIKMNPISASIVTGLIWAGWHIPYYLYFLNPEILKEQTSLGIPALILLSFILLPLQALAYAGLRLLSKSVWTTWLLHNVANAVSFALMTGGIVTLSKNFTSVFLTPGTEGVIYSLLMGAGGWGLYQHRKRLTPNS